MPASAVPAKRSADVQEAAWVADEDRFVLQQTRKKAVIRAKAGRAQPIDWLNVILAVIDPDRNPVDDDLDDRELEIVDPESVFSGLSNEDLIALDKKIEAVQNLESSRSNRDYWTMMRTICRDRRTHTETAAQSARGITSVSADLDKLLAPKTLAELERLEQQVTSKLTSDEPIDTDYWEHLLQSVLLYKAKARLRAISVSILSTRYNALAKQQKLEAAALQTRLLARPVSNANQASAKIQSSQRHVYDPEPMLRIEQRDQDVKVVDLADFTSDLEQARAKVKQAVFFPKKSSTTMVSVKRQKITHDASRELSAFDEEVAHGLADNEEIFDAELEVITKNRHIWATQHQPRKPEYFNRVVMGFEWNKYNQTHYDQDNLPPKVVQGYKFTVHYPDLIDITKAPRYKIERDDGRKRGQTLAPAGEEDTCIIRFSAGPPYEDLAFRIVDREWDYSAKRERGFKSSFDKGVLTLSFHFKKVFYRK